MIINVSRAKAFTLCKRKAFNQYHRRLEGARSMNLVDGGAFHAGVAKGRATKDWVAARDAARMEFDQSVAKSTIPEEQVYLIDDHWSLIEKMVGVFQQQYEQDVYQIIQPECEGEVEFPDSWHNCVFLHHLEWVHPDGRNEGTWVEKWRSPSPEAILEHRVGSPHDIRHAAHYDFNTSLGSACPCWQPHKLKFKTDAIVSWNNNLWLDEYKTTSISGDQFWRQWEIDIQPTAYIWAIWKILKLRPRGFFLHALNKPSEAQVSAWNKKRKSGPPGKVDDYIKYEREAFLRTEEDLTRVAQYLKEICMEWEEEVLSGSERMSQRTPFQLHPGSHSCFSYNRACDFLGACVAHEAPGTFDGMQVKSEEDYVEEAMGKLIQVGGVR